MKFNFYSRGDLSIAHGFLLCPPLEELSVPPILQFGRGGTPCHPRQRGTVILSSLGGGVTVGDGGGLKGD